MQKVLVAMVVAVLLCGCAFNAQTVTSTPDPASSTPADVSAVSKTITDSLKAITLKVGKTTAQQVVLKFGNPVHINHNQDGRFVYLYKFDFAYKNEPNRPHLKGLMALLFGANGVLERQHFYEDSHV